MSVKRVLHVVNISFVLPYYIGEQFDYFNAKGVKFFVACQPSVHLNKYGREKGFEILNVKVLREFSLLEDLKTIYKLVIFIRKNQIDVIIGHTPKGGLLGMTAGLIAGLSNRVYFRHGIMFETTTGAKRFILKNIEKLTGLLAKKVICVSPSVLQISEDENLSDPSKNIILNKGTCNGIDSLRKFNRSLISTEVLAALRSEYQIGPDDHVIGYVGRLVNDKGIKELIEAWKLLLQQRDNIKLLLVGPLEDRDGLSKEITSIIINEPSILYTGLRYDVNLHYCLMDIFILPSYREGFPTVVLEASAMELPVITTKATGCKDAILPEVTGIFTNLNPKDIAVSINYYLDNKEIAMKHGKAGREFVLTNFDQQVIWHEIERKVLALKA